VVRGINKDLSCDDGKQKLKTFFRMTREYIHKE